MLDRALPLPLAALRARGSTVDLLFGFWRFGPVRLCGAYRESAAQRFMGHEVTLTTLASLTTVAGLVEDKCM